MSQCIVGSSTEVSQKIGNTWFKIGGKLVTREKPNLQLRNFYKNFLGGSMQLKSICDVGLEIEFATIDRSKKSFQYAVGMNLPQWNVVHDGSTESHALSILGIPVVFLDSKHSQECIACFSYVSSVYGGELVSPILSSETNDYQNIVKKALKILQLDTSSMLFNVDRTSIHVHVNLGDSYPTYVLKNLVKLALMYEPFLYKIGGFGNINRGVTNNFIFCRPIYSPTVFNFETKYYPLFSADSLLNARTKEQFFTLLYNSLYCVEHTGKYVPQRYVGLNFFSILVRNSIEFRYANTTTNPDWLIAWINLCQSFVRKAFDTSVSVNVRRNLDDTSMYSEQEFMDFLTFIGVTSPYKEILINLYVQSQDIKYPIKYDVVSHVDTFNFDPSLLEVKASTLPIIDEKPINVRDTTSKLNSSLRAIKEVEESRRIQRETVGYVVKEKVDIDIFYKFFNTIDNAMGLNPFSSTEEKISYLKTTILKQHVCFVFPIFREGERFFFTVPKSIHVRKNVGGKRILFHLVDRKNVKLSTFDNANSITWNTEKHLGSGGYFMNLGMALQLLSDNIAEDANKVDGE